MVHPQPLVEKCVIDTGDTTWILVSTIFVLGMSPALAFFEAGMLRSKNTLSIISQVFVGNVLLSVMWLFFGYSLSFGTSILGVIGGLEHVFWIGVPYAECGPMASNLPAALFALFQMMFATITPLLMTGAYAERLRWDAFLAFTIAWEVLVYYPVCHWVWGRGFLSRMGVLDYAGGIVIHTTAGAAALVCALFVGPRRDFASFHGEYPPHNLPLAATGAALLWMGWFGFNGGSALGAGSLAVSSVVSTHVGACCSAIVWLFLSMRAHRPAATGILNGVLAGLAGITPASGYVNTQATIVIGLACGFLSYHGCQFSKGRLGIDDALDVHMVHGATGALGSLFVGVFGNLRDADMGGKFFEFQSGPKQFLLQVFGVVFVGAYAAVATWGILRTLQGWMGDLTHDDDRLEIGLDWVDHGEVAYHKLHVLSQPPGDPKGMMSASVGGETGSLHSLPTEEAYRRRSPNTSAHGPLRSHPSDASGDLPYQTSL
uniref:Ammonium transporter n=1 Tax=Hemiselmis tepida TaxID=464990 RepID=A0A7S0W7E8_9CRYP|mmetsp:Transcript_6806/g.17400  ORF Transcript_6806/g.17400 Transcript_6806/m.17400 type:complete len:487 (+) Transcript_6806:210-1670(+)